ncbi:MAG: nitrogen fixation protein FixH [Rhizobacter sp.]
MNRSTLDKPSAEPWWRFGMVWLVISGPLLVVVASFVSAWLAWGHIDPIVTDPTPAVAANEREASQAPAMKARNHAATPRQP